MQSQDRSATLRGRAPLNVAYRRSRVNRQYKKRKGEHEAPRNQLTLCCHVQSTDPRAKIRNLSGNTRRQKPKSHCSADKRESIYSRIRSDESGELRSHCRHGMKYRRHIRVRHKTKVRNIPDRVSIHDRPPEAAISLLLPYRKNLRTITTDNGSEFRNHRRIADALNAKVYFADSYASWQKGAIEKLNFSTPKDEFFKFLS